MSMALQRFLLAYCFDTASPTVLTESVSLIASQELHADHKQAKSQLTAACTERSVSTGAHCNSVKYHSVLLHIFMLLISQWSCWFAALHDLE